MLQAQISFYQITSAEYHPTLLQSSTIQHGYNEKYNPLAWHNSKATGHKRASVHLVLHDLG